MKASKADIKFYKGVLLEKIHTKAVNDGTIVSIYEMDNVIKDMCGVLGKSCNDITHEQMQDLKECAKFLADQLGVEIKDVD